VRYAKRRIGFACLNIFCTSHAFEHLFELHVIAKMVQNRGLERVISHRVNFIVDKVIRASLKDLLQTGFDVFQGILGLERQVFEQAVCCDELLFTRKLKGTETC